MIRAKSVFLGWFIRPHSAVTLRMLGFGARHTTVIFGLLKKWVKYWCLVHMVSVANGNKSWRLLMLLFHFYCYNFLIFLDKLLCTYTCMLIGRNQIKSKSMANTHIKGYLFNFKSNFIWARVVVLNTDVIVACKHQLQRFTMLGGLPFIMLEPQSWLKQRQV